MSASRRRCLRCHVAAALPLPCKRAGKAGGRWSRAAIDLLPYSPLSSPGRARRLVGMAAEWEGKLGMTPGSSPRPQRRPEGLRGLSGAPSPPSQPPPPPPPLSRPVAARPPHPISSQHPCLAHRRFKPAGGAARCEPHGPGAPGGQPRPRPAVVAGAGVSGRNRSTCACQAACSPLTAMLHPRLLDAALRMHDATLQAGPRLVSQ